MPILLPWGRINRVRCRDEHLTPNTQHPAGSQWRRAKDSLGSFAFLLPNFLGFLTFTFLPVLASLALSLTNWDILQPLAAKNFVGLSNFAELLGFHHEAGRLIANDPDFWKFLWNTIFLMLGIPIGIFGSLAVALLLNQKLRGVTVFRTIYFVPSICSGVAVALLWRWIYNPEYGLLNSFLMKFIHFKEPPMWLYDTALAKPALIIMGLWAGIGGMNCLLYLAGLQGIPQELYEAAEIDGASAWQKFRHITWTLLSPTTFFITIMSIIGGFQGGFMQAFLMTSGGPAGSTTTIMYYIYNNAFGGFYRMGYACAIAWVMFILVFGFTIVNWRLGSRLVHYS